MQAIRGFVMVVAPPFIGYCFYFFSVRQACYNWRSKLCDRDQPTYSPTTLEEMVYLRQPKPGSYRESMETMPLADNPGFRVREGFLADVERSMLMQEVKKLVDRNGRPYTREKRAGMKKELEALGIDGAFVDDIRFVSDMHEDPRRPKAAWGCGDSLRREALPPVLRELASRVQDKFSYIGELRHVYIEHTPTGKWFARPKLPHAHSGHDYVIVPLTGPNGIVFSMSPSLRSKTYELSEVIKQSWSTRDIDVFLPPGCLCRVFSTGRFRWCWSLRPGAMWFGHPDNPLPLGGDFKSKVPPPTLLAQQQHEDLGASSAHAAPKKKWWKFWGNSSSGVSLSPQVKSMANDLAATAAASSPAAATPSNNPFEEEEAIILLHFEGPVDNKKARRKFWRWEFFSYGLPPNKANFNWDPDLPPTEADVQKEGVVIWVTKNLMSFGQYG